MAKATAVFFSIRKVHGAFVCSIRGKQAGSIFQDGRTFWAACANHPKSAYDFATFNDAERWLFTNWT